MPNAASQHRAAVLWMILCCWLWSIAGFVTRYLEQARGFEVTFWRSVFAALTVVVVLPWLQQRAHRRDVLAQRVPADTQAPGLMSMLAPVLNGGWVVWASGLCWSVMFTCFMMALTMTSVANVLITQSLGPVITAVLAWVVLKRPVQARTWLAIVVAACGIGLMYVFDISELRGAALLGVLLALGVPIAAATNWIILQRAGGKGLDLSVSVLLGGTLSALVTLPMAMPFQATVHDLLLLALLGVFQLGLPCVLVVRTTRALTAPELSLLGLLEVIFGILQAWLFASEQPSLMTLVGGVLVLGALAANEWLGMRANRLQPA